MRLLTAIPLLFWASTSAMAQLAVLWATEPAAAVTHAASRDSALEATAPGDRCAHSSPAPIYPPFAIDLAPAAAHRVQPVWPLQPERGSSLPLRILTASRLLANPPPFGA